MNSITVKNQYQLTKWAAIIKECNDSGIKIKDWLKANNISKDQYYYWRRKLQDIASCCIYRPDKAHCTAF